MESMETFIAWISTHAPQAHWFIFVAILLAGLNVPISIDIVVVGAAFLAATVVPEHVWHLYGAVFLGCSLSAWIAYGVGRFVIAKMVRFPWFCRLMPLKRIEKIQQFYQEKGIWTFLIGRFIPFGVRNCIFMSSGMSRLSFSRFILWDLPACFLWSSTIFYTFFTLGQNFHALLKHLKMANLFIFLAFGVTVIALLWYKRRKKKETAPS